MTIRSIDINAHGFDERLVRLTKKLGPAEMTAVLEGPWVKYLQERAEARFKSEGDSASGGTWKALVPATEVYREIAGFPRAHPINVRSGRLKRWVTHSQGRVTQYGDGLELRWPRSEGSHNIPYSYRDEGAISTKFRNAQNNRPVVAVDQYDARALRDILNAHIKRR